MPSETMRIQRSILHLVRWLHARRKWFNLWAVRVVSFYFGYRVLNHEIYESKTADPLLIFLGLWLCGVAPASFFDGIRKVAHATDVSGGADQAAEEIAPTTELKSKDKEA